MSENTNDSTKYRFVPKPYANGELDHYRLMDSLPNRLPPELEHAAKKILWCGRRGLKDEAKDLREAILSLQMRLDYIEASATKGDAR